MPVVHHLLSFFLGFYRHGPGIWKNGVDVNNVVVIFGIFRKIHISIRKSLLLMGQCPPHTAFLYQLPSAAVQKNLHLSSLLLFKADIRNPLHGLLNIHCTSTSFCK